MNPLSDEAHQEPNEEAILATEIILNKFTLNTTNGFSDQEIQNSFNVQNFEYKNIVVDHFYPKVQSDASGKDNIIFISSSFNNIRQNEFSKTQANFLNEGVKSVESSDESIQNSSKSTLAETDLAMTREELQAHLAAQAAQTQASLAVQNGAIEARLGRFEERIDRAIDSMQTSRTEFRQDLNQFKIDVKTDLSQYEKDLKADNKSTRLTMIVTAIGTVIAIVGLNATVLSNMVASFESGKSTMQSINETTKRLEDLQERIEAQTQRSSSTPSKPPK